MAHAALDYIVARTTIPPVANAPAEGSALHKCIYGRQVAGRYHARSGRSVRAVRHAKE
jgi:hypothetical protein